MSYDHSEIEGMRFVLADCAKAHLHMPDLLAKAKAPKRAAKEYDAAVTELWAALVLVQRLQSDAQEGARSTMDPGLN